MLATARTRVDDLRGNGTTRPSDTDKLAYLNMSYANTSEHGGAHRSTRALRGAGAAARDQPRLRRDHTGPPGRGRRGQRVSPVVRERPPRRRPAERGLDRRIRAGTRLRGQIHRLPAGQHRRVRPQHHRGRQPPVVRAAAVLAGAVLADRAPRQPPPVARARGRPPAVHELARRLRRVGRGRARPCRVERQALPAARGDGRLERDRRGHAARGALAHRARVRRAHLRRRRAARAPPADQPRADGRRLPRLLGPQGLRAVRNGRPGAPR